MYALVYIFFHFNNIWEYDEVTGKAVAVLSVVAVLRGGFCFAGVQGTAAMKIRWDRLLPLLVK